MNLCLASAMARDDKKLFQLQSMDMILALKNLQGIYSMKRWIQTT